MVLEFCIGCVVLYYVSIVTYILQYVAPSRGSLAILVSAEEKGAALPI
jgi:hypothetical protein